MYIYMYAKMLNYSTNEANDSDNNTGSQSSKIVTNDLVECLSHV